MWRAAVRQDGAATAGGTASSYHRAMANVELAILTVAVVALLSALVVRLTPGAPRRRTRMLVGLVPGILGAVLVLTLNEDLVPDEVETWALPIIVVAISGLMAGLTIRGLARS
jgi:NhaP-type Na+/H+ or K+/H+ antiporter